MFVDFAGMDSTITKHADRRASMDSLFLMIFLLTVMWILGVSADVTELSGDAKISGGVSVLSTTIGVTVNDQSLLISACSSVETSKFKY